MATLIVSKPKILAPRPGGHSIFFFFFLGEYVPHRFSKVGSTEQIFFFKKQGSWEQIFTKIGVFVAEILPKSERNGPKNAKKSGKRRA